MPFWSTLFTSMFLHGGWMHLGGNMLYLWIFGDNLEKVMGGVRFLIFYLACGLAASLAHILFGPGSTIPAVGAPWRHQRILVGYLVLFPKHGPGAHARRYRHVPAIVVLGFWIVIQIINGSVHGGDNRNRWLAYMAHMAGSSRTRAGQLMASQRQPAFA